MKKIKLLFLVLCTWGSTYAQTEYQLPPKEILELADIKAPSQSVVSRNNKYLALLDRSLYKTLDELAEPELRLAGLRINPENFSLSRGTYYNGLKIQELISKKEITIEGLPSPLKMQGFSFSPSERYCAFVNAGKDNLALWVIDLQTGNAKMVLHEEPTSIMSANSSRELRYCITLN